MNLLKEFLRNFLATTLTVTSGLILVLGLIVFPWIGCSFLIGYFVSVFFGEAAGVISGSFLGICFVAAFLHTFVGKFGKIADELVKRIWELVKKIV